MKSMTRQYSTIIILLAGMITFAFMAPKRKVIFLGDSLTQAGNGQGGFITMMRDDLKKKGLEDKYELVGKGIGGNRVRELLARLEKDVIEEKPDLVFIMVGINDVGFFTWHPSEGGTPADQYELALRYMVKRIHQRGGAVVLCTPTVIEEKYDGTNPLDPELDKYAEMVRKVALETNSRLCDTRRVFINYLIENNKENKLKDVLTTDYVHLNEKGNRLVADAMLQFLK